uniref:Uncharacterized protein n=1 Tax=Solanum tuberosum TaxID=4113 RepID=M1DHZ7_SOLTU
MPVEFNDLMMMAENVGVPATLENPPATTSDVQMGDATNRAFDAETDDDLAEAHGREAEESIFGNFPSLLETIVQLVTQTPTDETFTAAPSGSGAAILAEEISGTDAQVYAATPDTEAPPHGETA